MTQASPADPFDPSTSRTLDSGLRTISDRWWPIASGFTPVLPDVRVVALLAQSSGDASAREEFKRLLHEGLVILKNAAVPGVLI